MVERPPGNIVLTNTATIRHANKGKLLTEEHKKNISLNRRGGRKKKTNTE